MSTEFRPATAADMSDVHALNQRNLPAVGDVTLDRMHFFLEKAPYFELAFAAGTLAGFLIGLDEDCSEYESKNYDWFRSRYPSFAYVDRVCVAEAARDQGLGSKLYARFIAWAEDQGKPWLFAEVNTIPNNPGSRRFHARHGFEEQGRFRPYGPDKEVVMLGREI